MLNVSWNKEKSKTYAFKHVETRMHEKYKVLGIAMHQQLEDMLPKSTEFIICTIWNVIN